jgi:transketolase
MAGAHYKLDNLVGIIDRNRLQISGTTEEVMGLEPLEDKWSAFGWNVVSIDGNDMAALVEALEAVPSVQDKPTLLMANTVKGKGVSFAENVPHWHHHVPSEAELELALSELSAAIEALTQEGQVR